MPDPANPGWYSWDIVDDERFNRQVLGNLLVREEAGPGGVPMVRLRMQPEVRHSNLLDAVHGGTIMALTDVALFAAFQILSGGDAGGSVTLDMSHQFIGAGQIGEPLDAVAEVLRETGRLAFVRGLVVQGDNRIAAFSGTVRKPSKR